jgi:hypothetical protein
LHYGVCLELGNGISTGAINNIPADMEMNRSYTLRPKYDNAPLQFRIKAFRSGVRMTLGDDLQKVFLRYSSDCKGWLERRRMHTTSLAMTSIAGYTLGLGDRHMCNIISNNSTAKFVHIDFSDCFDIAVNGEMYPEAVPFRQTRVIVNALDISGTDASAGALEGAMRPRSTHAQEFSDLTSRLQQLRSGRSKLGPDPFSPIAEIEAQIKGVSGQGNPAVEDHARETEAMMRRYDQVRGLLEGQSPPGFLAQLNALAEQLERDSDDKRRLLLDCCRVLARNVDPRDINTLRDDIRTLAQGCQGVNRGAWAATLGQRQTAADQGNTFIDQEGSNLPRLAV